MTFGLGFLVLVWFVCSFVGGGVFGFGFFGGFVCLFFYLSITVAFMAHKERA